MPKVHCISRKWLEQRKLQLCLNQAERMVNQVSLSSSSDKNRCGARSPLAAAPSSRGTLHPLCHSIVDNSVRPERSGRQRASKKRRSARHTKNATVITPREGETTALPRDADDNSVISDTPVQKNNRKRKLRSGASLAISEATVGIVPHDNDL